MVRKSRHVLLISTRAREQEAVFLDKRRRGPHIHRTLGIPIDSFYVKVNGTLQTVVIKVQPHTHLNYTLAVDSQRGTVNRRTLVYFYQAKV